jgi:hypothetical protein
MWIVPTRNHFRHLIKTKKNPKMNKSNPINLGPLTLDIRPREELFFLKKIQKSHISCIKFDTNFFIPKPKEILICVCVCVCVSRTNKIVYENGPIRTTKHEKKKFAYWHWGRLCVNICKHILQIWPWFNWSSSVEYLKRHLIRNYYQSCRFYRLASVGWIKINKIERESVHAHGFWGSV